VRQGRLQLDLSRGGAAHSGPSERHSRLKALLQVALLLAAPLACAESEPVLDAGRLVAPELLSGPGWRVEPRVPVRGYQARFTIRSRWGDIEADSVELLAVRVGEMRAVERLHDVGVTRVLAASAGERLGEPLADVAAVAGSPVRSAVGLPRGVTRYFSERWQNLRKRARKLGDRGHDLVMESGSPYDDADGPLGAAGDDTPGPSRTWTQRRGRDVVREVKREASFPSARRSLAARLGIDPDTRNPLIAPRLDELAWAEASGRFAAGEALGLLGADVLEVVAYAGDVNRLVLQEADVEVRERTQQLLAPTCADTRLLRVFARDKAYTAALQQQFVELYLQLQATQGCEALLETALMAGDEPQARFVVNSLRLLVHQLGAEAHGGRFVPQGALLAYETPAGELVLPLAVDWLAWTPELRRWFALPAIDGRPRRMLLVAGGISDKAQHALTRRGWSLVSSVPYPGAPPYRRPFDLDVAP
jgi:hypothetical protein